MIRIRDYPGSVFAVAISAGTIAVALNGCTPAQEQTALATPGGQLFCRVHQAGGGELTVALADASVMASQPGAAPLAILATGMTKLYVDAACAAAAPAGGTSVPVPPPVGPAVVPIVAVTPPATLGSSARGHEAPA